MSMNKTCPISNFTSEERSDGIRFCSIRNSRPGRWLGARGKLILLLLEQNIERGQRAIAASDVLLHLDLICITQFIARVYLLLEHAQVVANHNDLMKERLQRYFLRLD